MTSHRRLPNILITGTPGVGKSLLAQKLVEEVAQDMELIDVNAIVQSKALHSGRDEEYDALILDEDAVVDELDPKMSLPRGGYVVDYHAADFFPERWFDRVVVLRTDNTVLYDRLMARGYSALKVAENVEAEIMQVLLDQATESYQDHVVVQMRSDSIDDVDDNFHALKQWCQEWDDRAQALAQNNDQAMRP